MQFNIQVRETPRERDHMKENVVVVMHKSILPQMAVFGLFCFWRAADLKIHACSTEHNQNAPIYSAHTHTNPVTGTKSPDANLIILCRCGSWSRNSNRVRFCDGNVDWVCSTESGWCITQTVELGYFSLPCCDNISLHLLITSFCLSTVLFFIKWMLYYFFVPLLFTILSYSNRGLVIVQIQWHQIQNFPAEDQQQDSYNQ